MEESFKKEIQILFNKHKISSNFIYTIIYIEKDFNEYCLTVSFENKFQIKGLYIKNDFDLRPNTILSNCKIILKKTNDFNIKIFIKKYQIYEESSSEDSFENKNEIISVEPLIEYNINSDNIISFLNSIKLFQDKIIEEEVFLIIQISETIKVKNTITSEEYLIDSTKLEIPDNLEINQFIFIKYFSLVNKTIKIYNFSFIQKANDFQIFKLLENQIDTLNNFKYNDDFYELESIEKNKEIYLEYIFSKVVLKNKNENFIIILDKFNRLIRYNYKVEEEIDLYDLIFITNCSIKKSPENKFIFELLLKKNSLFYVSKDLILNKEIVINNYTILDIFFPDFSKENYYNKIIINEKEVSIKQKRQIYLFKFRNELFNEIVPFDIKFKKRKYTFKFFITHNLINKINIFINNSNKNTCAIDYCYYNIYNGEIPDIIPITIDSKKYYIEHSNNFDSLNRISFILLNVPVNEQIKKIKDKNGVISAQIWYTASINKNNNKTRYNITQIFDVEEANPIVYKKYELKDKKFEIFEDFYFEIIHYFKDCQNENNILKYFEKFSKRVEKIKEELELLEKYYNIEYDPESADQRTYFIYANILLFKAFKNLKKSCKNNSNLFLEAWKFYLKQYSEFLNTINDDNYNLMFHQKIRILHTYFLNYFNSNNKEKINKNPCKFWNIKNYKENSNNSYALALTFNKNIIKNLKENSALTIGYLQLNSFILTNYFIENPNKTYSLSNKPLILIKYHLLKSYEDFLLINSESPKGTFRTNDSFNKENRVTVINERILFDDDGSEYFL